MGLLRAADQFCADCVKQLCEKLLGGPFVPPKRGEAFEFSGGRGERRGLPE